MSREAQPGRDLSRQGHAVGPHTRQGAIVRTAVVPSHDPQGRSNPAQCSHPGGAEAVERQGVLNGDPPRQPSGPRPEALHPGPNTLRAPQDREPMKDLFSRNPARLAPPVLQRRGAGRAAISMTDSTHQHWQETARGKRRPRLFWAWPCGSPPAAATSRGNGCHLGLGQEP